MARVRILPLRRLAGMLAVVSLCVASAELAVPAAAATAPSPIINVFGAAGTFGQLGTATPSGQSLQELAVSGWGFASGKSAYLTTTSSDGTVFMANESE